MFPNIPEVIPSETALLQQFSFAADGISYRPNLIQAYPWLRMVLYIINKAFDFVEYFNPRYQKSLSEHRNTYKNPYIG